MTLVSDIKAGARAFTGDLSTIMFADADLLRYINHGCMEILKRTRSLQKSTTVTNATLTSTDPYGGVLLPTDFLLEYEVYFGVIGALTKLPRMPFSGFGGDNLQPGSAAPTMYAIGGFDSSTFRRVMYFYPWLSPGLTNVNYVLRYIPTPPALTADGDTIPVPPMLDDALTMYVVRRCKIQEEDFQAASFLQGEVDQKINEFLQYMGESSAMRNFQVPEEMYQSYSGWEN